MKLSRKLSLKIICILAFGIAPSYQQNCSSQSNSDINLPNLAVNSGQPVGNCCSICQNTQGCQGFAWNNYQGGTCWLKAGTGPIITANGVTVGILSGACSLQSNSDINLPDLAVSSGQPLQNCCNICKNAEGCKGFAWNNYQGGTCWLKAGSGPIIPNPGVSVGIVDGSIFSGGCNSGAGCWWSGCQPNNWAQKGCFPSNRWKQTDTKPCDNGLEYCCCSVDGSSTPPNTGPSQGQALVSYAQFSNAVVSNQYPQPTQVQYAAFILSLPKGLISTLEEAAMALAQFIHESDGLRAKREYACIVTGCPGSYADPSCDATGQRYYGRGYIQLSWCTNYRAASQDLLGDTSLVAKPDSVATDENLAWNTAFWFWKVNVHGKPGVSSGEFGATTLAINGALECGNGPNVATAKIRFQKYGKVRAAFGLSGSGDERGC